MSRTVLIPLVGLILSGMGGLLLIVVQNTLGKLAGLSVLYLGGSVLLLNVCSLQMSISMFVVGISVVALLGTGHRGHRTDDVSADDSRKKMAFRFLLALILGVLAYTATDMLRMWIPVRRTVLLIVLWISMMNLFSLSLDDDLLFRCVYLQAICLAFTILYVYMESSVLVFACFAVINLLMAFGSAVLTVEKEPAAADAGEREP